MSTPNEPLRLQNARIIDGRGSTPTPDGTILIGRDGRIAYAGPTLGAPPAEPAERTWDLGGRTVLPGFIDAHVHLTVQVSQGPFHALTTDPAYRAYEASRRLRDTLDAGVTMARDLAGATLGLRDAVADGLLIGPRLQIAVAAISPTGGHADHHFHGGDVHLHGEASGLVADSADQARIAVRKVLRAGADVIKICTSGGMGSAHDDPDDEGLRVDEVRAVVDEAARRGAVPVAAHAQGLAGIRAAVLGGVTSVEHGYGVDDEMLDLMNERGTYLVPTLSTLFAIDRDRMPAYHYEKKVRWAERTRRNIARAIERNARIVMGTDSGVGPHGANLRELAYLVELGMNPADAITAGTARAAELLGVDHETGTIEPGKRADLVVTATDPLADIGALSDPANIALVFQDGILRKGVDEANDRMPAADV